MPLTDFRTRQMLFNSTPPRVRTQPGMEVMGPNRPPLIQQSQQPDMMSLYNQPSPALDAYKQHILAMPTREQYEPTKMNRVGAALVGISEGMHRGAGAGFTAAQNVLDEPYKTALTDYSNKGQGLGQLADIENQDVKSKLAYMNEYQKNNRENRKADADIDNIKSQITTREQLTPAQVANLESQAATRGITYQHNKRDGHLYQVTADGKQTDMGAYDLTPEQRSTLDVKEFTQKEGVKLKNDKEMEGVKLGNAKSLFNFEQPIKDKSATDTHEKNRKTDAANPIPYNAFNSTNPAQYEIAAKSAINDVIQEFPGYAKFAAVNPASAIKADQTGYKDYLGKIEEAKARIIKGGMKTPVVKLANQSPLDAPNKTSGPNVDDIVDYQGKKVKVTKIYPNGTFDYEENP